MIGTCSATLGCILSSLEALESRRQTDLGGADYNGNSRKLEKETEWTPNQAHGQSR